MNNSPIFIVGVPRSGTTLLAAMLSANYRMICGPETHFFRWLSKSDVNRLCDPQTWPGPALDFICSITHNSFSGDGGRISLTEKYKLSKEEISVYLKSSHPSIFRILSSITELSMLSVGKSRWIEKTPDHIEYVNQIRHYFPNSPIIRIIRDPRDNALSLTKVPWGAKSYLEAIFYWKRLIEVSDNFFKTDKQSYTIRYEDLISSPKDELGKLCNFLGEDFEEKMLDTSSTGKMLNSRKAAWKDKASQPLDPGRISIWKKELNEAENRLAEAIVGDYLQVFGYPCEGKYDRLGAIYPNAQHSLFSYEHLQLISTKGIRFWKVQAGEKPTVRIYIGEPGFNWPFETDSKSMVKEYLQIFLELFMARIKKQRIYWISGNNKEIRIGIKAFLLKQLLEPYRLNSYSSIDIPTP
jgi:hypothetical protein